MLASVFYNRLVINMRLQTDPTVQYALGYDADHDTWWTTPLSLDDLKIDSPYNTYLHSGLPPTPIASPSVAAVLAALNPIKTSCLYYFSDKAGDIHCTETYAEHVKLLKEYYKN